jgi:hypothetical protein
MLLHDARSGGHSASIVLLAHILPVGQEHYCERFGDQFTPIYRIEQSQHAERWRYGVEVRALRTIYVDRTPHPSDQRGSISIDSYRRSTWTVDRIPNPVRTWLWHL